MRGLLEYCESSLGMSPDQVVEFVSSLETANPQLDEIFDQVKTR
jgi:hypothetical protein